MFGQGGLCGDEINATGHAQMPQKQQGFAIERRDFQMKKQVFCAATDTFKAPAGEKPLQVGNGGGMSMRMGAAMNFAHHPARQYLLQVTRKEFNFRQLRHGVSGIARSRAPQGGMKAEKKST